LVERQLCKLEVRGSNPLASRPQGVKAKSTGDGVHFWMDWEINPLASNLINDSVIVDGNR
jgi:hypothetical protein